MKVVKSDWRRKFSEEKIEALLRIKVEGPKIEEFIKEHSSDAVVFWWDAKERSKGANGKKKNKKNKNVRIVLQKLIGLILQTNLSTAFLKGAVMNVKAMLFSSLVTVRQN